MSSAKSSPPGEVDAKTALFTSDGAIQQSSCATRPPSDQPMTSTGAWEEPTARATASVSSVRSRMLAAPSPDAPKLRGSNVTTFRPPSPSRSTTEPQSAAHPAQPLMRSVGVPVPLLVL